MLNDHGLPARQIADRPIADPGVLQPDEERLRAAPLASRALDVGPVALGAARDFAGIAHPPAVALEEAPVFDVTVGEQERELEWLARHLGERRILEEGHPFVVVGTDLLPVYDHLDPLAGPPSGDGGEPCAARA